jgi:hypothetical protein
VLGVFGDIIRPIECSVCAAAIEPENKRQNIPTAAKTNHLPEFAFLFGMAFPPQKRQHSLGTDNSEECKIAQGNAPCAFTEPDVKVSLHATLVVEPLNHGVC